MKSWDDGVGRLRPLHSGSAEIVPHGAKKRSTGPPVEILTSEGTVFAAAE